MPHSPRVLSCTWIAVLVAVGGFLVWTHSTRVQRIDFLSHQSGWSVDAPAMAADSLTGYAGGERSLIVPERTPGSRQWIMQTQQMLASGEWRIRRIDHENAPYGRPLHDPSPYRWWLGTLAWLDHVVSGRPLGASVEQVARIAEPPLHLLLLIGTTAFVVRRFGSVPAALVALGMGTLFPFAAGFSAGLPEQHGLERAVALWSLLLLLAGMTAVQAPSGAPRRWAGARGWFLGAGLLGGLGLWLNVGHAAPILAGIVAGALGAAWLARRSRSAAPPPPWRAWSCGVGAMSVAGWMIEFLPAGIGLRLEMNHPIHALFWLGVGELLARATAMIQRRGPFAGARDMVAVIAAVAGVVALPVAIGVTGSDPWSGDPSVSRLVDVGPIEAENVRAWVLRDGFSAAFGATVFPVIVGVFAAVPLLNRAVRLEQRVAIITVLGPALVALFLACARLRYWHTFDAMLLVVMVAVSAGGSWPALRGAVRWSWLGACAGAAVVGASQAVPQRGQAAERSLDEGEILSLVERDLAHWLGRRAGAGNAIVLASPDVTTSLAYHGGLRGVATINWENQDGFSAAVRLASARSRDEAQELIQARGITHVVLVSWDAFSDDYVRLGRGLPPDAAVPGNSFFGALDRWEPPAWMQVVPYQLPAIEGFKGYRVMVFEVVENQDPAVAASRLVEAFVEMGNLEAARAAAAGLQQYPGDVGVLAARAFVHVASRDATGLAGVMSEFVPLVESGADGFLPWDRRLSVASVLAHGRRFDLARDRLKGCLAEVDETRLRSLTTEALFRLHRLCKPFSLEIPDPALRELALRLLPPARRRAL